MRSLQDQIGWCSRVQWILGVAIVLIALASYFFGYRPSSGKLQALHMQTDTKQRELSTNQSRTQIRPIVEQKVADSKKKLDRFDKKLPRQQDIGEFLRDITHLSQQSSLRKWEVKPEVPRHGELYSELPIDLSFEGDFLSVFSFLRQMDQMQRLTRVRDLTVKAKNSVSGMVEVQLSMNIYFSEG